MADHGQVMFLTGNPPLALLVWTFVYLGTLMGWGCYMGVGQVVAPTHPATAAHLVRGSLWVHPVQ